VIEPGSKSALDKTKKLNVGVIGTLGTVNSNSYKRALKKINSKVKVYQLPCPLFVQLAEDGWHNNHIAQAVADEYLKSFKEYSIDTMILGCTHYPLLKDVIQKSVGKNVSLIDSGIETAKEAKRIMQSKGLLNPHKITERNHSIFYVSDFPHKFKTVSQRFLGKELMHVHKVKL
jgi:glutamate racemase